MTYAQTLNLLFQLEESILGGTTTRRNEAVIVRGEGCWLYDADGRRYLDLGSAQGVTLLGHCHPSLSRAIAEQAQTLISCPNFLYNDVRARFAARLVEVLPPHLKHVFLANSGAEAIDGAIKFARLTTGRTRLIAFRSAFHGRTVGALSLTWEKKYREPFLPLLDTVHLPYNNLAKVDEALDESVAAVFVEVVQGEGGVNIGDGDFLRGVEQLCRERGALLVIDEIQTGFGRTGRWFGFEHHDLQPDIICLAKGLGAGFPMGAIAYTERVQEKLYVGAHGSTFGGNPLACAAGLAAIQTYQSEGLVERSARLGDYFLRRLREELADLALVRDVRGLGLMLAVELRQKAGPYLKALMETHGVIALPAGPNVIRFLPPLIITEEEIEIGVQATAAVLRQETSAE
ncbi:MULTISPECIES: aspartate aminotransferase family protein [Caldilinea]|jgi:acetylornithine/LysW-gamma-L-lysine aminotransferase|uniref:Acetylornithine/succinyldiaminopimelate aminotransferase n=1 Tax=Caldilinea aerophila (strain DSM 14535 / JCM 11387 / NBRC 104270 / STL-6-O1) TaxID=926550 RepID=I0IA58_CALAS|nr:MULTISPECIES: acetylornithine/succinylornithine family transaminase [Caldilinea]BAM02146.1 acetylornithine/succinyldiaminopimelate aminotransferase [Caldilinea aerophila DSM 14535 = NBRC 104270]GIV75345.1 MAG: acetylornithine aminotransferase [Caldilinea sp.]